MRNPIGRCLFLLLGLALFAAPVHAQSQKRGDQTRLTRVDLDESGGTIVTAYDAVQLLRSRWLSPPRGRQAGSNMTGTGGGATTVIVYVDGIRQPDVENSLRRVRGAEIAEMRYFDQNRAIQEFGPGHEAGAIKVTTVSKPK
ncbi:MAG: hypothetical protein O2973_08595 [Gemmatimonadetes bacterium]|nr:hypothetical protein [Gemmatimonadota bacterium]